MNITYYDALGVEQNAVTAEIIKAHRNLSRYVHPDKTNSATSSIQVLINTAKEILVDPQKRREYDRELQAGGSRNNGRSENSTEAETLRRQVRAVHTQLEHERRTYEHLLRQKDEALQREKERKHKQLEQQARQSEEMLRQRNTKLKKERRLSQQKSRQKEEELQREKERIEAESIVPFQCGICSLIVPSSNFWASGCCGELFCGECLISRGQITFCPKICCQKPIQVVLGNTSPVGWTQNHPHTKALIENVAPSCMGCRKNIAKSKFDAHKLECPALNQRCYKCNGNGTLPGPFLTLAGCILCSGSGILHGEWTKCFACLSAGAPQVMDFNRICQMCFGNRCYKGKWSPCFRCDCEGTVTQINADLANDYIPTMKKDRNDAAIFFQSITAMSKYADKSFEELRLESYTVTERVVTCDVCLGKKKLEGEWIKCTSCEAGRTRMFDGTEMHCKICNGKGSVKNGSVVAAW